VNKITLDFLAYQWRREG